MMWETVVPTRQKSDFRVVTLVDEMRSCRSIRLYGCIGFLYAFLIVDNFLGRHSYYPVGFFLERRRSTTTHQESSDHQLVTSDNHTQQQQQQPTTTHDDDTADDILSVFREKRNERNKLFLQTLAQQQQPRNYSREHSPRDHYAPTGGTVPSDDHRLYPDPKSWIQIDNGTCYDTAPEPVFAWQYRAPTAILIGTMKGGTHALSEYLWSHPLIVPPQNGGYELHFFDGKYFQRDANGISQRTNQYNYAQRVRRMYNLHNSTHGVTIHDSPRYLLWSDRIPDAILCVTPWTKLLAVLRDPVERAVSHYRFQNEARQRRGEKMVDWRTWVEDDWRLLKRAGVVQDWNQVDFETFSGSLAEMEAWKTYLRNENSQMILGRGLYAIQLEHFFAAMDRVGKPRSELLVIRSEELRHETQHVYNLTLDFLGLPRHILTDVSAKHETSKDSVALPSDLREEMNQFFEPYNRRLYRLLEWKHVWKYE